MKKNIRSTDLIDDIKTRKGFMRLNPKRTPLWEKLESGALTLISTDERPYSGIIELYINDGGLDHDTPKKHFKKVFREEILPAIRKRMKNDIKNFWLVLNFNVDILTKVTFDDGQQEVTT